MSRRHSVHNEIDDFEDAGLSKTEQKKAMERLQALGERLAELRTVRLKKMPISETLFVALEELKHLKAHEAVRRHKQYIGKLMRHENEEATGQPHAEPTDGNAGGALTHSGRPRHQRCRTPLPRR